MINETVLQIQRGMNETSCDCYALHESEADLL